MADEKSVPIISISFRKDYPMPVLHQHDNDSDAVKIAHDKEKTKRFTLYIGSLVLVAVFGIYFVFRASDNGGTRKFDLDIKGGKIALSVDKPIVAQVGVATSEYKTSKGDISYTTGRVDKDVIKQFENAGSIFSPNSFSGKNFVNKEAGFIFSNEHPENWQVIHNSSIASTRATIVNNFVSVDGRLNNINVVIDQLPRPQSLTEYVEENVQQTIDLGMINQMPVISYNLPSKTAFLRFQNLTTGGITDQKIILSGSTAYIATANYSPSGGNAEILSDMQEMVTSFTVIGE